MRVPNQAKRGALFSVKLLIKLRWKKEEWYQHNYFGTLVPTYLRNYVLVIVEKENYIFKIKIITAVFNF